MDTVTMEDKLLRFIEDCWENQYSLEILLFLGRHPSTQFNQLVFLRGSMEHRMDMERATKNLTQKGLLSVAYNNDVPLYRLTADEPLRSLVVKLVTLSRQQLQAALKQIHAKCGALSMLPAAT